MPRGRRMLWLLVPAVGLTPSALRGNCAGVSPTASTTLTAIPVATGLTGRPLFVTAPPGDANRIFIVEQDGFIRVKTRGQPTNVTSLFLDIRAKVQATRTTAFNEMGLLGLAFDPDYATNGLFYLDYNEGPTAGPWFTVVASYRASASDPDVADPGSEVRLLSFLQPQQQHKGGQLQFGPDGFLYVSSGDGGGQSDPHLECGNGQSRATLLGKILRLDVRGIDPASLPPDCGGAAAGYRIPATNPFAGGTGGDCDEVWSYGLRNPWRFAFDPATSDIYVADVGQNCWEEIDFAPLGGAGRNYGWRVMEGDHCFDPIDQSNCDPAGETCSTSVDCRDPSLTLPAVVYSHSAGCAVTGGFVYHGCRLPAIAGTYFYGDFCAGFVHTLEMVGGTVSNPIDRTGELGLGSSLAFGLTSFGLDDQGEIYIADRKGTVLMIAPPFQDLEVSGAGAASQFLLAPAAWSWEDLSFSTSHPVSSYRVYRSAPGASMACVFASASPRWPGGDPAVPAVKQAFFYLVTALNPSGQETLSSNPPALLLPDPCP